MELLFIYRKRKKFTCFIIYFLKKSIVCLKHTELKALLLERYDPFHGRVVLSS